MKEKIIEALKIMGFIPVPIDDWAYEFEFEGLSYLYMLNDDEDCLNISVPLGAKLTDRNADKFYDVVNSVNKDLFYVKAYKRDDDHIWLSYELEYNEENKEELDMIFARMIHALNHAARFVYRNIDDTFFDEDEQEN